MTALFSSGWSGMGIIDDMERGSWTASWSAPLHRSSLIVGRLAYEALNLVVQASIIGVLALAPGCALRVGGSADSRILVLGAASAGGRVRRHCRMRSRWCCASASR